MWWRARESASFLPWLRVYDTGNTTRASDGTLKAASPVVKLYADGSFETNNESEGCTVTRIKAGEYLIEGCMGMNSDAAWGGIDGGFDIPKDRNGQALTGAVLRLIILLADSVDLDAAFLSANQGCSGAYRLLLLNNASATGEQYRYRQAKNHIFHSCYIPGHS